MLSKALVTTLFGVVAGIIAIGTAIVQYYAQEEAEKQKSQYQDSIKTANQTIIGLQKQTIEAQHKTQEQTERNLAKSEEIIKLATENTKLQEELKNQVTGGDSKPVLIIMTNTQSEYIANAQYIYFDLKIAGKYPLNSVKMKIDDPWGKYGAPFYGIPVGVGTRGLEFYNPPRYQLAQQWQSKKDIDVGSIQPNQQKQVYQTVLVPFDNGAGRIITDGIFAIDIEWPAGVVRYSITTKFENGETDLKSIQVLDDWKMVDAHKYLEFNNYKNKPRKPTSVF